MSLVVKALSKKIQERQILSDIDIVLTPGEIVGLIGRNGVGKTTLFKTIMHQYLPEAGQVIIDERDVDIDPSFYPRVFFLDDQNLYFAQESLQFAVNMAQMVYPEFDAKRFWTLMASNNLGPKQRYNQLSRGLKAYVRIGLAVASGAPYILLDEPFEGLDIIVRQQILALILQEVTDHNRAFLLASHDLDELDGLSDRVYMLKDTHIAGEYDLETLRQHAQKLQLVFQDNVVPEVVNQGHIIVQTGRVLEVVFTNYTETIDANLRAAQPILMEPMSLTLVDLFKLNVEDAK